MGDGVGSLTEIKVENTTLLKSSFAEASVAKYLCLRTFMCGNGDYTDEKYVLFKMYEVKQVNRPGKLQQMLSLWCRTETFF